MSVTSRDNQAEKMEVRHVSSTAELFGINACTILLISETCTGLLGTSSRMTYALDPGRSSRPILYMRASSLKPGWEIIPVP